MKPATSVTVRSVKGDVIMRRFKSKKYSLKSEFEFNEVFIILFF